MKKTINKKGKWVCFPSPKNWDKETKIKHEGWSYLNGKKEEYFGTFLTCGQKCFTESSKNYVCFTRPFCIWKDKNGKYNYHRVKPHYLDN